MTSVRIVLAADLQSYSRRAFLKSNFAQSTDRCFGTLRAYEFLKVSDQSKRSQSNNARAGGPPRGHRRYEGLSAMGDGRLTTYSGESFHLA